MEANGRNLLRYMRGDDVWAVKTKLLALGYLKKATHNRFGNDTFRAVKAFQTANGLTADGIVGPKTRATLFPEDTPVAAAEAGALTDAAEAGGALTDAAETAKGASKAEVGETSALAGGACPKETVNAFWELPSHIGEDAANAIKPDLARVSEKRRALCLMALSYATDAGNADRPRGFYIRGANLYDRDLTLHVMTQRRLDAYFKREAYAPYFDGGRREMMERFARVHGYGIPGADCSGFIVGLWRRQGLAAAGFDATADSLFSRYAKETDSPIPGDLCHKSGHIGLYVGGGYAVEAAGGAYGVQLTACKKRKLHNFVTGRTDTLKGWTGYGTPKCL